MPGEKRDVTGGKIMVLLDKQPSKNKYDKQE
jgi:hypothetical protein